MQINQSLYNQRRRKNAAIMAFSGVASLIGLAVLVWILFVLFPMAFTPSIGKSSPKTHRHPAPRAGACATPSSAA